jgi:hypothetical protein
VNAQPPGTAPQGSYDPYRQPPQQNPPPGGYPPPQTPYPPQSIQPPSYSAQSYVQQGGSTPAKRRRGVAVPLLISLIVLLVIGEAALLTLSTHSRNVLDRQLTAEKKQAAADAEETTVPGAADPPALDAVTLQTKYKAVQDADKAAAGAVTTWHNVVGTKFGTVRQAIQHCYYVVDDYNRSAAPYPQQQLGGLPARIDLASPNTDCSRKTLNLI